MQEWIRLYNKDHLSNAELRTELRLQRHVARLFEKQIYNSQCELDRYLKNGTGKESSIALREAKVEFYSMLHTAARACVKSLEEKVARRSNRKADYKAIRVQGRKTRKHLERAAPVLSTWNLDAFMLIAEDRGYKIKEVLYEDISKQLDMPYNYVDKLLRTGKFTWGQVLTLGTMLEMTPREFAETFMRGYFEEVADGQFRAWGDTEQFAYRALPRVSKTLEPPTEVILVDSDGQPYFELDVGKMVFDRAEDEINFEGD